MTVRVDVLSLIAALVVSVLGVWGYRDLSVRLQRLEVGQTLSADLDAGARSATDPPVSPAPQHGTCSGSIPPESVSSVLAAAGPALKACFDRAEPRLPPDAVVELGARVQAAGRIDELRAVTPMPNPGLERCLLAEATTWRFAPPTGDSCAQLRLPLAAPP